MDTKLLIEDGILLKRFVLPYKPNVADIKAPQGWTPDRSVPWIRERADAMLRERALVGKPGTEEFALMAAEREYGARLRERKRPWPGWVPVSLRPQDRCYRKAYRELFIRMNPDIEPGLPEKIVQVKGDWPPDGRYRFHKGVMEVVDGPDTKIPKHAV